MVGQERLDLCCYFDPISPWAWRVSVWLREVARQRPLEIEWKFFSLARANAHRESYPRQDLHQQSGKAFRALLMARRRGGNAAVNRLGLALGQARHEHGQDLSQDAVVEAALKRAGLDPCLLAAALADPSTAEQLEQEHDAIVAAGAFGVPTLVLDGLAPTFGPVLTVPPAGPAAITLWDHVVWLIRQPYFYELKRQRPT